MLNTIFTTGAEAQLGPQISPRLSIHDMVAAKDQKPFNLYCHALMKWYEDLDEKADASTWKISGIHGLPYERWNGAGPAKPETPDVGYCHHSTILFPTWHRPYCALYEQMLQKYAIEVAQSFSTPDRDDWIRAANAFRLPYWDWSIHELPPPEVYKSAKVTITQPNGKTESIDNPILKYTFKSGRGPTPPEGSDIKLQNLATMRTTGRYVGYPHPVRSFETYCESNFPEISQRTGQLLLYVKTWDGFSTKAVTQPGAGENTGSLESIHDSVHVMIGGSRHDSGHMSWPEVAAFDPIFWLHHSNVDRILGLWQAINYKVDIIPRQAGSGNGTWNTSEDEWLRGTTELEPFRANPDDPTLWWVSDACRKQPGTLRYTYPELEGIDSDPQKASEQVRAKVEQIYTDNNRKLFPAFRASIPQLAQPASFSAGSGHAAQRVASDSSESVQWTVRIRAQRKDLKNVTSIIICLGGVPPANDDYVTDPHYVGEFSPFINTLTEQCANCAHNQHTVVEGYVHVTGNMMERGVHVLDNNACEHYLRDNLKWVILLRDGQYGHARDVPSLECLVISTPLRPSHTFGAALPDVGPIEKHNSVTVGLPGGRVLDPNRA